eukprot:Blabericola_migrator_1__328@NODE_1084_length_5492_cov_106_716682_g643_i1_p7_GENE_NODE_1084_length_5492_cov_106_716682_g643_i1NODE_1084_length_5492_cov_106_716682_g643_i1_p7_ORF_typecomplete_len105_score24_24Dynactin_p22/PF07426_11/5_2e07DUF2730/PF10805_8/3_5e06NPV_P10/PF05531_12/0_00033ATG16/PF08614_11/0_0011DUF4763/PF15960_5/0_0016Bacillus_HBL/PF05791_11/0_0029NBP1/PF08537_10/0_0035MscS_porin/PF12795_7/0_0046DUF16/PF01519_16/0_01TMCO5/PF14992_6/0_012CCCAP/PF15964_5/0_014PV1/PF06637_11/0_017Myos
MNAARIMEGWMETESKKTFVLENEQTIRFIADQCRRIEEMNNTHKQLPSKGDISKLSDRVTALQSQVSEMSKRAAEIDAQLVAVAERLQSANQLFTSIILSLAA